MEIRIDPDKVPATVAEAVQALLAGMDAEVIELLEKPSKTTMVKIRESGTGREHLQPVETGPVAELHHSIGRQMRNAWSLWEDSPIRRDAIEAFGIAHGDDICALIMEWTAAHVRGEHDWQPTEFLKRIRAHWLRSGMTPLTAAGLEDPNVTEQTVGIACEQWKVKRFMRWLHTDGFKRRHCGELAEGNPQDGKGKFKLHLIQVKTTNAVRLKGCIEGYQRKVQKYKPGGNG